MPAPFASPNFGERRGVSVPDLVVIHYTAMPALADARARLCDPVAEVSAHWLIGTDGAVEQLVDERMRAWHAGQGAWGGIGDVNSHSVGIELDNPGDRPFPEPQMAALERILRAIMGRWSIPPERVIGHSDMAPERKGDPGRRFDWQRLAIGGLAVWPGAGGDTDAPLVPSLRTFGYPGGAAEHLLHAFRLRFRPWATGAEDCEDRRRASDLARRYPAA